MEQFRCSIACNETRLLLFSCTSLTWEKMHVEPLLFSKKPQAAASRTAQPVFSVGGFDALQEAITERGEVGTRHLLSWVGLFSPGIKDRTSKMASSCPRGG